tara:strand:- start:724 stop:1434 length:711 start_codon:yes stop_codon:yes gene_type:complete
MAAPKRSLIGVVGGMGPLASAAFLTSIYDVGLRTPEQTSPRVVLWSDPEVLDRTDAIENSHVDELGRAIERSVEALLGVGAARVLVACVSAHSAFGALPVRLATRCVSLVNLVFDEVASLRTNHLLLTTRGTHQARVFESHPRWSELGKHFTLLDPAHLDELHGQIYALKAGGAPDSAMLTIRGLLDAYQTPSFIAACTELHIVTRAIRRDPGSHGLLPHVDPLWTAAHLVAGDQL